MNGRKVTKDGHGYNVLFILFYLGTEKIQRCSRANRRQQIWHPDFHRTGKIIFFFFNQCDVNNLHCTWLIHTLHQVGYLLNHFSVKRWREVVVYKTQTAQEDFFNNEMQRCAKSNEVAYTEHFLERNWSFPESKTSSSSRRAVRLLLWAVFAFEPSG